MENNDILNESRDRQAYEADNEEFPSLDRENNDNPSLTGRDGSQVTSREHRDDAPIGVTAVESDPIMIGQRHSHHNHLTEVPVANQHVGIEHFCNVTAEPSSHRQGQEESLSDIHITAPPPNYEEYMIMEEYKNKGLVCSGAQTEPVSCFCRCHPQTYSPGHEVPGNFGGETSGGNVGYTPFVCTHQTFPYGSGNPYGFQGQAQNMNMAGGQEIADNVAVHHVHVYSPAIGNRNPLTNDVPPVLQDKTTKRCCLSLVILIVVGGIIFGIVAITTY